MQGKLDKAVKVSVKVEEQLHNKIDELENGMREMNAMVNIKKEEVKTL